MRVKRDCRWVGRGRPSAAWEVLTQVGESIFPRALGKRDYNILAFPPLHHSRWKRYLCTLTKKISLQTGTVFAKLRAEQFNCVPGKKLLG
ncbi:hypothetical protein CEXT_192231 [Caerostris extrusa]|uniref:Uncharacterized protein n=1 Tax=Caerostris extrusa TaxID=172846 RepID=A0AAV4WVZ9_CAEEX|nr:hypothetical protein CEXT_192231 [Caerostris extrusa]